MYEDRTLQPAEAVKLLALGLLIAKDKSYGDLAREISYFCARVVGPSLDLLGSSLEILKLDGLVSITGDKQGDSDQRMMQITDLGKERFLALMASSMRAPLNDINRLVLLIKLRFMELLPREQQQDQMEICLELLIKQQAWTMELAKDHANSLLTGWLETEIANLQSLHHYILDKSIQLDKN